MTKKCNICRVNVSENRERCAGCQGLAPTHIIVNYPDNETNVLFRASDGMGFAHQKSVVIVIGEDKNRNVSRVFIDLASAERYIREVLPLLDLAGLDVKPAEGEGYPAQIAKALVAIAEKGLEVVVETRDGGKGLILPSSAMDLPQGIRKFSN